MVARFTTYDTASRVVLHSQCLLKRSRKYFAIYVFNLVYIVFLVFFRALSRGPRIRPIGMQGHEGLFQTRPISIRIQKRLQEIRVLPQSTSKCRPSSQSSVLFARLVIGTPQVDKCKYGRITRIFRLF